MMGRAVNAESMAAASSLRFVRLTELPEHEVLL
jgi:hypothetical protein